MSYCPECGSEYKDDERECIDCAIPLLPGPSPTKAESENEPDSSAHVVTIRVFRGPTAIMEADLARNILAEQGIPVILPGETSAEILPGVDVVQVQVDADDAEEAAEILQSYFDRETGPPEPVETPDADADPKPKP